MTLPEIGTTWKTPEGRVLAVEGHHKHEDVFQPEHNATWVCVWYLFIGNMDRAGDHVNLLPSFFENYEQITLGEEIIAGEGLAVSGGVITKEHIPWEVYLVDRADGCKGHFAIGRWNPAGYQEVWNLRKHTWASASDEVLTREEADKMLQSISFHPMTPSIRSPQ